MNRDERAAPSALVVSPAPWAVDIFMGSQSYVRASDGTIVASCHWITGKQGVPAMGNARLISAAPDLLEALRPFAGFLDAMEKMGGAFPKTGAFYTLTAHGVGEREITVEDFKTARAAIAKAEGQASEGSGS